MVINDDWQTRLLDPVEQSSDEATLNDPAPAEDSQSAVEISVIMPCLK